MVAVSEALGRADFFRTRIDDSIDVPHKEWHHFVVQGGGGRIVVNFSISRQEQPHGRSLGRIVVLARHDRWSGVVEEVSIEDIELTRPGTSGRFGESRVVYEDGGYLLELDLPTRAISGRLRFVPDSSPFIESNQPLGRGRMSWLFVPRLRADGWLTVDGVRFGMRDAAAYHDHNWGRFQWGDDFGWQWGSLLPNRSDSSWSLVFMRMTDRAGTAALSQCLYLWKGGRPVTAFRDTSMAFTSRGFLRRAPEITVPGIMRLLAPGSASDIPESIEIEADNEAGSVRCRVACEDFVRVALPAEQGSRGVVALHEVAANVEVEGRIGDDDIKMEGAGVLEFLQ